MESNKLTSKQTIHLLILGVIVSSCTYFCANKGLKSELIVLEEKLSYRESETSQLKKENSALKTDVANLKQQIHECLNNKPRCCNICCGTGICNKCGGMGLRTCYYHDTDGDGYCTFCKNPRQVIGLVNCFQCSGQKICQSCGGKGY